MAVFSRHYTKYLNVYTNDLMTKLAHTHCKAKRKNTDTSQTQQLTMSQ